MSPFVWNEKAVLPVSFDANSWFRFTYLERKASGWLGYMGDTSSPLFAPWGFPTCKKDKEVEKK